MANCFVNSKSWVRIPPPAPLDRISDYCALDRTSDHQVGDSSRDRC